MTHNNLLAVAMLCHPKIWNLVKGVSKIVMQKFRSEERLQRLAQQPDKRSELTPARPILLM